MYGAVEVSPSSSPEIVVTTTEFKVYKRRWLYLVCICLANMSNAIVRFFFLKSFFFALKIVLI
jgi:hypothetical protein